MRVEIKEDIQQLYDEYYDEKQSKWRKFSAISKFSHIITLSEGLIFNKVLEVGAGDGSILSLLDENNFATALYALEISKSGLEIINQLNLKNLIEATSFDGYNIPYPDNFFDLLILSHVLEHVEYPRMLLREIKRVSKFQIIEVPREYHHNIDKQMNHYLSYGHINVYTPSLLRFLLKSDNFEILKDIKGFYSDDILKFNANTKFKLFKINLFIFVRNFIYSCRFIPEWRRDTMINYYAVLTR